MPSPERMFYQYGAYHVYNRGNHRQAIFNEDSDYRYFLKLSQLNARKFDINISAYCLMRNHVHFAIQQMGSDSASISKWMGNSTMSYVHYFNKKYGLVGRIFQSAFKSRLVVNDEDLVNLISYIHNNPSEFIDPLLYPWSSYSSQLSVTSQYKPRVLVAK